MRSLNQNQARFLNSGRIVGHPDRTRPSGTKYDPEIMNSGLGTVSRSSIHMGGARGFCMITTVLACARRRRGLALSEVATLKKGS